MGSGAAGADTVYVRPKRDQAVDVVHRASNHAVRFIRSTECGLQVNPQSIWAGRSMGRFGAFTGILMQRINETITGPLERRALEWFCRRMPAWVSPDMLTLLGVGGAAISFAGFALAGCGPAYIAIGITGLVINWFGDSLDGTLARYRDEERPQYGFFLDHITDTISMFLIAAGVGLSTYVNMMTSIAVLLTYYFLLILSLITCIVTGVFRISFNGFGPTELRLFIMFGAVTTAFGRPAVFQWYSYTLTIYDVVLIIFSMFLFTVFVRQAIKTARELDLTDPQKPNRH